MQWDKNTEKILNDFVFFDCRLADHPKIRTGVFWSDPESLILCERSPSQVFNHRGAFRLKVGEGVAGHVYTRKSSLIIHDVNSLPLIPDNEIQFQTISDKYQIRSMICVPLLIGAKAIGVLSIDSYEPEFFSEEHVDIARLLSAILVYIKKGIEFNGVTPSSIEIGKALKQVRIDIGLTQSDLAQRIQKNRITISRWESGAQPPTFRRLYEWGSALGLLSSVKSALVTVVDVTPKMLRFLKEDPNLLRSLSPSQFEQFVAGRLDSMGFDVTLTGETSHKDGGIDLIAVPKIPSVGSFLLAGQVKHHRGNQKTGREAVDRLLSWKNSHFRLGLLVTNTEFTKRKWGQVYI